MKADHDSSEHLPQSEQSDTPPNTTQPPLRTRAGMAWVGICAAVLVAIAIIIFVAQNTQRVHVSFLWFDVVTPLALVALIAAAAGSIVAVAFGTARIIQLRKAVRATTRDVNRRNVAK